MPELVFVNGRVLTQDPRRPEVEALLIRDGRIALAGSTAGVREAAGTRSRLVDLGGRWLLPGFIDTHTHLVEWGVSRQGVDLSTGTHLEALRDLLRPAARTTPSDRWIVGYGWDESLLAEGRPLARRDLDRWALPHPLFLWRACGHLAVVNRPALRALGLPEESPGVMTEEAAREAYRKIPFSEEELRAGVERAAQEALALGITTVHEMLDRPEALPWLEELPGPRFRTYLYREHLDLIKTEFGRVSDRARLCGVKVFVDGTLGARTAALLEPYTDAPAAAGSLLVLREEVEALLEEADEAGWQIAFHAIGDRAIEAVLTVCEAVFDRRGTWVCHRLEHGLLMKPEYLARLKRLGLALSVQPNFLAQWGGGKGLYAKRLGDRWKGIAPIRSLLARRVSVAFGSDNLPLGPLQGIAAAVDHPVPEERISVAEAIRLYTQAGAALAGDGEELGMLSEGMRADCVVLSGDLLTDPAACRVELTVLGGKVLYETP
jgi:predicted amidohydrolase YtcJ